MPKYITLNRAATYVPHRVNAKNITIELYVTIDNLLPNKAGFVQSSLNPSGTLVRFDEEDILVGNIRPYLKKIWCASKTGGCSPDVLALRANPGFVPRFLYYALFRDDFFQHMMKGSKGTKMPRGDKNQILNFHIPDFDKKTQQKIAAVLSALDDKIELNNKINAELEAMAKTLYDYWFVQFDFPDLSGRPYKSSGGAMVWNEQLKREIPDGWEVKRLSSIADTGSGGTPKSTIQEFYEGGKIPWINSGELNNPFIIGTENFITELGLKNSNAKLFPKNSILVAMYGATAGKVSFLKIEATTNQAICALIPKKEETNFYIKFCIEDLYTYLVNLSSGSARDNLSQDKIKNLELILPKSELLAKFHLSVKPFFETYYLNSLQNQTLSTLRDWLLPMLMNGQVSVGEVYEKVGNVLSVAAEDGTCYQNKSTL